MFKLMILFFCKYTLILILMHTLRSAKYNNGDPGL